VKICQVSNRSRCVVLRTNWCVLPVDLQFSRWLIGIAGSYRQFALGRPSMNSSDLSPRSFYRSMFRLAAGVAAFGVMASLRFRERPESDCDLGQPGSDPVGR